MEIEQNDTKMMIRWKKQQYMAELSADFLTNQFKMTGYENGKCVFML